MIWIPFHFMINKIEAWKKKQIELRRIQLNWMSHISSRLYLRAETFGIQARKFCILLNQKQPLLHVSNSRLWLHLRKKTSLFHVPILSHFEIVEIIDPNTREIIWSESFAWTKDNFKALLKGFFFIWVCFLPFAGKHRSRTVRNRFYINFFKI